jgi:DNA-binding beta-propeller fold protein YncE
MKDKTKVLSNGLRVSIIVLIISSLFISVFEPASADGPEIPGYTIQDGKRVPAPTGYVQMAVFSGDEQSSGSFSAPQDIFLDLQTGNLLVADTGNNRVVVLDPQGKVKFVIGGEQAGLVAPEGVFVDQNGDIWVADTGNQRVAVFSPEGVFKREHKKPDSSYLTEVAFTPSKLAVDKRGFIYIVTGSKNDLGVLVIDGSDRFRGYFGRTKVKFNIRRLIARVVATKAQRKRMLTVQPAPLGNLFLDPQGFIYAVSPVLTLDQIQRLNSVGTNVYGDIGTRTGAGKLWEKLLGKEGIFFGESETIWGWNDAMRMSVPERKNPQFLDIAVDELGIVSVIDERNAQIYQFDPAGNMLTTFGGSGSSEGFFQRPVSITAGKDGLLYILDSGRNNIQVFRPTELTRKIHEASYEYFTGSYEKAAQIWNEVSQRNTNFSLAHSGLGKALMSQKRYAEAMREYYYAENQTDYSTAFGEIRYLWMRKNFAWLGIGFIGLAATGAIAWRKNQSGRSALMGKIQELRERLGLKAVPILLILTILSWMVSLSVVSFQYRTRRPEEISLLIESIKIIIPWISWCVSASMVGEIFFGEGTFRKIIIASAWALWPLILLPVPVNLLTNIMTRDEKSLYDVAWAIIWGLTFLQFLLVIKNTHNFEWGQSISVMLLTLVGIIALWVLAGLIYALTAEIFRFFRDLLLEVYVRLY